MKKDGGESHLGESQDGAQKIDHIPPNQVFAMNLIYLSRGAPPSRPRAEDYDSYAEKSSLKDAVSEIIQRESMPNPDDGHVNKDRSDQSGLTQVSKRHRQRREQIVHEPEGQTHVPAAPEFLNVDGGERGVEIGRTLDAKQLSDAESYVRVAVKVGKKLQQIPRRRHQHNAVRIV